MPKEPLWEYIIFHHAKSQAMTALSWILRPFDRLSAAEIYNVLRLRSRVFVVEQQCLYLDMDNKDQEAFHLLGMQGDSLAAYARLFAPGTYYRESAIGRIVTAPEVRGTGIGKLLVKESLEIARRLYGDGPVRIGAQRHLERFYVGLGFQVAGEPYVEDGILHVEMVFSG